MAKRFVVANMDRIEAVECPCGEAQRAFIDDVDGVASFHIVRSKGDARTHYHKKTTEIYYILEGVGHVQLDDETINVGPGVSVLIKPECRHRIVGELKFINVPIPAFDPEDEWFDES